MLYRKGTRVSVLLAFVVGMVLVPLSTSAFISAERWLDGPMRRFAIDPNFEGLLRRPDGNWGVPGAANAVRQAATTWNNGTVFNFIEEPWYNSYYGFDPIRVGNTNLSSTFFVPGCERLNSFAITCPYRGRDNSLQEVETVFNNVDVRYSLNGDTSWGNHDVQNLATHEFGHWIAASDIYDRKYIIHDTLSRIFENGV